MNIVILSGNLGKDPELKKLSGGKVVCRFTLATNETWRDARGDKQERTEWHNVSVWGALGESVAKYKKKGERIEVEGKLHHDTYEKDGHTNNYSEVVAEKVHFL